MEAEEISQNIVHVPVLWREILSLVSRSPAAGTGIFVDCTLGEGGHSEQLLMKFPELKIIAFERDPELLAVAKERLEIFGDRIIFLNKNFSGMPSYLEREGLVVNYILFDYGISSYHLEKSGRGFSFRNREPLDMKLDNGAGISASDILNKASAEELGDIFYRLGGERWSRKIAANIVKQRRVSRFETTDQLSEAVLKAIPSKFRVKNIHPATRVFQALRITVNDELRAIGEGLNSLWKYVNKGGLIMAISFHSIEDRIVKNVFKQWERGCSCGLEPLQCECHNKPFVSVLTKKPVLPSAEELSANHRSHSAKLRVCSRR